MTNTIDSSKQKLNDKVQSAQRYNVNILYTLFTYKRIRSQVRESSPPPPPPCTKYCDLTCDFLFSFITVPVLCILITTILGNLLLHIV